MGLKSHEIPAAHEVVKGNPLIDGPYLDDYNAAHEAARRDLKLAGQQSQKERYESEEVDKAKTEGTELGTGSEERVISETGTTRTVVRTESKLDENLQNTDEGVNKPEGSTNGGEETAGNNPSFDSDVEGTDQR